MSTANASQTVQVKRLIKAPRTRVYAAWTTAEQLKRWFGSGHCSLQDAALDFRVGGEYHITSKHAEMGLMTVRGVYKELTAPSRIVFTWKWDDDKDWENVETVVTVEMEEAEGGTMVTVTHTGFPNEQSVGGHNQGWEASLCTLAAQAAVVTEMFGPGRISWNELVTTDMAGAGAFYSKLFGWEPVQFRGGDMPYFLFKQGSGDVGGMMTMPGVPPFWLPYMTVASADEAAKSITALGGTVERGPFDIPTVGRIAIAKDPQGAVFGIFQPNC